MLKNSPPAKPALLLFLASYFIYQANLRPIATADSLPAALLPFSILLDGRLDLDRFAGVFMVGRSGPPYFLFEKAGHFYSTYQPAPSIFLTPLYIPVVLALDPGYMPPADLILIARIMEKLIAGALAAASVAFLFLLLDRLTSRRGALLLSAAYAFGTITWAIASQALWQHSPSELLLVLTLLALGRWAEDTSTPRFLALAGLWSGLALMVRLTDALLPAAIVVVLLLRRTPVRTAGAFLAPVIVCFSTITAWNLWLFHDIRGYNFATALTRDLLGGIAGLLFSPGRGLLIYSPFLLFAAAGLAMRRHWSAGPQALLVPVSAIYCLAHLLVASSIGTWWGGNCWGPRYLTEIMPFLTLLIVPALDSILASSWQRLLFLTLLLYSSAIQFVGVFCYPRGSWESTPVSSDDHPERFWDWADNPVRRAIGGGLALETHRIVLEGALHGKASAIRKMRESGFKGY
jgi:hypothetical protein